MAAGVSPVALGRVVRLGLASGGPFREGEK